MELLSNAEIEAQYGRIPSPPPGMAISVFPPAREHMWDPYWWDSGGRDIIRQRHIFDRHEGEEQKELLKGILEEFPGKGARMLEKAAIEGYPGAIRNILQLDVKIGKNGIAVGKANTVREEDESEGEDEEFFPLHQTAFYGHFECMKILVEEGGVDVNAKDDTRGISLLDATLQGHNEIVRWLLERGADPTNKRENGFDVIQYATTAGNLGTVKLILNALELKDVKVDFVALLDQAAESVNLELLEFVLQRAGFPSPGQKLTKTQHEAIEKNICSPIEKNSMECFELLLSYITPKTADHKFAPYEFIDAQNKSDVFNAVEPSIENTELFQLVWETFFLPFKGQLLKAEPGIPSYEQCLNRRLISSAQGGALGTLRLIVETYGASVNHISYKYHQTPLGSACATNDTDIGQYLLDGGADIHIGHGIYANGPTSLHYAISNGPSCHKAVMLLLRNGGPVEHLDETLQTIKIGTEMVAVASKSYRAPVYLRTKGDHENVMTDIEESIAPFTVGEGDLEWLRDLQVRKRDERLKEREEGGRRLMTVEDAVGVEGDDGWEERMGLC